MLKAFSYLSRLVAPAHPTPQPRTDWTPTPLPLLLWSLHLDA